MPNQLPNLLLLCSFSLNFIPAIDAQETTYLRDHSSSDTRPTIEDSSLAGKYSFREVFNSTFDTPEVLTQNARMWRREDMGVSNNAGQHRQAEGRRHAAWYDRYLHETAFVRDGVLVQRGYVADKRLDGFVSRDSGDQPRNHSYVDPDPRDVGTINFADFELHTSWLDTFAVKSVDGKQVPVLADDDLVKKKDYWGQSGKTDTASPNLTFSPGTFFEIEVSFAAMGAGRQEQFFLNSPRLAPSAQTK